MSVEKNISIKYSTETIIKYWKDYFFKKHTKDIIVNFVLIIIALLIYFYSEFIALAAIIISICAIYLLFTFYFYYYAVISNIKRRKKYYDNLFILLNEENIQLIGNLTESKVKWNFYSQVFNGKSYYLLFDEFGKFILIPKEELLKEEDLLWFENKLKDAGIKEKQL